MLKLFPRLLLVAGIGLTGAACQDPAYQTAPTAYNNGYYAPAPAQPYGYAQPAPQQYGYAQPAYGYAQPAPQYGYAQPAPAYYAQQQQQQVTYNSTDGRRYTGVTVTNRGQNGNRDDVVTQQVVCGSQYYDGYRTRTAPRC